MSKELFYYVDTQDDFNRITKEFGLRAVFMNTIVSDKFENFKLSFFLITKDGKKYTIKDDIYFETDDNLVNIKLRNKQQAYKVGYIKSNFRRKSLKWLSEAGYSHKKLRECVYFTDMNMQIKKER